MSLFDSLSGFFTKDAQQLIELAVDPARTDRGGGEDVLAEQHYFRVKLAQMFLRKQSQFFVAKYPVAYSSVTATFDGEPREIANVADASRLTLQQNAQGDYVARNFMLTPLLPFRGGAVRIAASLHAVNGENQLTGVIGALGSVADLLVVPQLSSAIKIARPVAAGIQSLMAGANGAAHLTYASSFVAASSKGGSRTALSDGYRAVLRAPQGQIATADLCVVNDELRIGADSATAQPFTACDFLLLHVESREDRDDVNEIRAITDPFNEALSAAQRGDAAKASALYSVVVDAVLRTPELTKADRRRVGDQLKLDFDEYTKGFARAGATRSISKGYDLARQLARNPMSAQQAGLLGEPTYEDLLPKAAATRRPATR
jgi:hypothetical protein